MTSRRAPRASLFACAVALFLTPAATAVADDYLMFGPSLAVWIQDNLAPRPPAPSPDGCRAAPNRGHDEIHAHHRGACTVPFAVDESHFATDAGHTVTIVDADQWSALTTVEFAAFDAIVIGDAGCDFDSLEIGTGGLLDPVLANRETWGPAVTGHLFLHTFDPIFHFNQNDPGGGTTQEQFQAMQDLTVEGMEFAASAGGTGLYFASACRSYADGRPGLLSLVAPLLAPTAGGDDISITAPTHPAMTSLTGPVLSDWLNSYHGRFEGFSTALEVLATGGEGGPVRGETDVVILATREPIGDALVFADGFESGTVGAWDALVPGAGSPAEGSTP
ncbi:MAG: hypothetical protein AAFX50_05730 [Acidobacteriota bacterium]